MGRDSAVELQGVIERYYQACDSFSRTDPAPIKALCSHSDDMTLANPFGPAVHGWDKVSAALDHASSRFSDGWVNEFTRIATYESADLACIHDLERWHTRLGDDADVSMFEIRVTTVFRREDGEWRVVHRHADPITTADVRGPLRKS